VYKATLGGKISPKTGNRVFWNLSSEAEMSKATAAITPVSNLSSDAKPATSEKGTLRPFLQPKLPNGNLGNEAKSEHGGSTPPAPASAEQAARGPDTAQAVNRGNFLLGIRPALREVCAVAPHLAFTSLSYDLLDADTEFLGRLALGVSDFSRTLFSPARRALVRTHRLIIRALSPS
jgi:hypothetical protein